MDEDCKQKFVQWKEHGGLPELLNCIVDEATPDEYVQMMNWFYNERDSQRYRGRHALCGFECICCQEKPKSPQNQKSYESLEHRIHNLEHRAERDEIAFQNHVHSPYCSAVGMKYGSH